MAPPPATAVADAMNPPARPRDSQANIDIMAVTKGFHWPWLRIGRISGVFLTAGKSHLRKLDHPKPFGGRPSSPSPGGSGRVLEKNRELYRRLA